MNAAAQDPRREAQEIHEEALRAQREAARKAEENIASANQVLQKPPSRKFRVPAPKKK